MKQNGFTSIILILFILVVAGIGGWYLLNQSSLKSLVPTPTPTLNIVATPTVDPTANWKTYMNTEYGYSIKYPANWEILTGDTAVDFKIKSQQGEIINVFRQINPQQLGVRVWLEQNFPESFTSSFTNTILSGKEAVKSEKEKTIYTLLTNKEILTINYLECEGPGCGAGSLDNQTFNLMLSTFKFIGSKVEEKIGCTSSRPEVCTMECITNPPYICGSDGKSYCNKCAVCADSKVDWYIIQNEPCGI